MTETSNNANDQKPKREKADKNLHYTFTGGYDIYYTGLAKGNRPNKVKRRI
jgi:hypothetical protein